MCVCALSRASLLSPQDPLAAAAIVAVRVKEARDLAPFASTQQEHERKRHDQRHPHPHCASHNVRALVRGRVAQAIELFGLKDDSKQDWPGSCQCGGCLTDLDGGHCGWRARGKKQSSGWMVDRASESYCWLHQPGVLDSVPPPWLCLLLYLSLSHSRLLYFWSVGTLCRCTICGRRRMCECLRIAMIIMAMRIKHRKC